MFVLLFFAMTFDLTNLLPENALITQARFMLMESFLIFFIVLSVLCLVKFTKLNQRSVHTQCKTTLDFRL